LRDIEGLSYPEALRHLGRDVPSSVRRKRGKEPSQRDCENRAYSLAHAAREVVREKMRFWQRSYENAGNYENNVYMLPKTLDEEVARLHLGQLGVQLTELTPEQAEYLGIPVEGPYKPAHYRY